MDIDCPNSNLLKRCLSVPTINSIIKEVKQQMTSTQATNTSSRDTPSPLLNIFTPRPRRYSASFSPLKGGVGTSGNVNGGPRLTPRVSQLRQEECADITNSREVNHERELREAMQMSQSWEDLTLVAENWSCKSNDDYGNPLHVNLPIGGPITCSSPSPTRSGLRCYPYGPSPSPTQKTFATRRSMSPISMRPSSLGTVKRKFELDDNVIIGLPSSSTSSTICNNYSPPPFKKMAFSSERIPSPIYQITPSSSPICPSPCPSDYSYEGGRTTPKLLFPKLYSQNNNNSFYPTSQTVSPSTIMMDPVDLTVNTQQLTKSTEDDGNNVTVINELTGIRDAIEIEQMCTIDELTFNNDKDDDDDDDNDADDEINKKNINLTDLLKKQNCNKIINKRSDNNTNNHNNNMNIDINLSNNIIINNNNNNNNCYNNINNCNNNQTEILLTNNNDEDEDVEKKINK